MWQLAQSQGSQESCTTSDDWPFPLVYGYSGEFSLEEYALRCFYSVLSSPHWKTCWKGRHTDFDGTPEEIEGLVEDTAEFHRTK